ncbi:MAG: helix-turn-helix domain-containing protein [Treponema sp.]|nr:helix-turn-helix domain-containing protein [Treponema sp.]
MKKTEKILDEIERLKNDRLLLETRLLSLEKDLIEAAQETEMLWSRAQAAQYLNISERHLDDMRVAGKIRCRNISGSIRFHPEDIKHDGEPGYGAGDTMAKGRPRKGG